MTAVTEKFKENDYLLYLGNGICQIDEIRTEDFGGMGEKRYYVIHSLHDAASVIFVPTDSERLVGSMLPLMSAEEIDATIKQADCEELEWISDNKQRAAHFNEVIQTGNRVEIHKIFRALSLLKKETEAKKKKFYASDDRVLMASGKIVTDELSFVLGIAANEVVPYILRILGKDE